MKEGFDREIFRCEESNSDMNLSKYELEVEFWDEIFSQHEELLLGFKWASLNMAEVVRHLIDIDSHLAALVELDTKIFEEFILSCARNGVVADVVGRFSDIDKALDNEDYAKAKAFRGIDLHRLDRKEGGSYLN